MTRVNYFEGKEARRIMDSMEEKSYQQIIGIPNAVNLVYNSERKYIASFHRSTDLSDPKDCSVWSMWNSAEYKIGKSSTTIPTEQFLDWLNENYPEDFEMFLWHPEIWEDRFDVL